MVTSIIDFFHLFQPHIEEQLWYKFCCILYIYLVNQPLQSSHYGQTSLANSQLISWPLVVIKGALLLDIWQIEISQLFGVAKV